MLPAQEEAKSFESEKSCVNQGSNYLPRSLKILRKKMGATQFWMARHAFVWIIFEFISSRNIIELANPKTTFVYGKSSYTAPNSIRQSLPLSNGYLYIHLIHLFNSAQICFCQVKLNLTIREHLGQINFFWCFFF